MKLSRNFFRFLFLLSGVVVVYITVNFFLDLHRYSQLSHEVAADFESWSIEEVRPSKYIVVTSYHYTLKGVTYHEHYRITKPVYPNIYLAQEHLEKWKETQKWVWFNPKDPHQSSLMRPFPFKKGVHLLLSITVFLYFLWLNFYVRKVHPDLS